MKTDTELIQPRYGSREKRILQQIMAVLALFRKIFKP
jgi:hypothetical protein